MDGGRRRGPIVSYQWMGEEDVDLSLAINGWGRRRGPIVCYQWMGEEDVDLSLAINGWGKKTWTYR